ncbi:putative ribonuclease H-like domain-containing protein [Tanacetum coccineum]|uniref:Ribonuclease H-like domain-containing protein n=1 Tax=Tanacetum coccineum TaxID=301880 RepID=A0ABQ4XS06_9ASTR
MDVEKVLVITALKDDLRKLKGKALVDNDVTKHPSDPEMLKIDVEPITPKLLNKKIAHSAYIKHTQEEATVLRDLVEHVKSKYLLDQSLESACNIKKDKIQQTPSSTQKNKVEAHPKKVKSSLKIKDYVVEPKGTAHVHHSKLNANSELKCVKCNGCMLFDNHDLCVLDFINNVNARTKSKSVKKNSKRKVWKPTGKVFTNIGYIWRPTGRTFTIVGNACPLTRITTTTKVPLRKPTALDNETSKPVVTLVYSRKLGNLKLMFLLANLRSSKLFSARIGLVRGLPKLKFEKDHLCSTCAMGKSKKKPHKPKSEDTNQEKLYLLHMDLCGPMRVTSVNGKKYILIIVNDYSRFTWVKCLRSKDKAPDFIINFLKMIQKVGISHETYVARSPQQNGVVERRDRKLIEAARTMLIYAKALLFLWAEAVATVCYTQNCSIVRLCHGKTPYELLHDKLPDLSFFHVFGALCYPTNDSENLGKLQPKADIDFDELTVMASEHSSSRPTLHEMTPATISSGLVPNPPPSTPFIPPSRTDYDLLFQSLFDELLTPPPGVDCPAPEVIALIVEVVAPKPVVSTGSPSSTTVDQDAPSPSNSQTIPETQSPVIPNYVEEDNHDLDVAHMNNDPFFGIPIPENDFEASSSNVIPTIVHTATSNSEHVTKWTKDHPLENIIGELERPVSTRLQLHEQSLFCYYDAFLTLVEPKNYKDTLTQACWIEAMQDELNEFERLEV